ncbi:MAG TPA: DMT family transporter [Actinoplanes sp.]
MASDVSLIDRAPLDHATGDGGRRHRPTRPRLPRQEFALLAITAVWGSTFLTVQKGLAVAGPWSFVGLRFGIAALALATLSFPSLRGLTRRELAVGTAVGLALAAGYGLQTVGLQSIPSSTSAFLTALYVPLVPLLQWAITRRTPSAGGWAGIAVAFGGLLLLTGATTAGLHLGSGEIVTLLGTVAIAAEILLIGHFAGTVDTRRVTMVQLAVCALLAFTARPLAGEPLPTPSWTLVVIVGGLGVASAVIQVTMNWAQRSVSPTRATVIYAGEPVWAAMLGRVAGERLTATSLAGGALIVLAVLISELSVRGSRALSQGRQITTAISRVRSENQPLAEAARRRRRRSSSKTSSRFPNRCGADPDSEKTAETTSSRLRFTTSPRSTVTRRGPVNPVRRKTSSSVVVSRDGLVVPGRVRT